MLFRIADAIDAALLKTLQAALEDPDLFETGQKTAGWSARPVKNNLQARGTTRTRVLGEQLERTLRNHVLFATAARPKAFVRTLFSRYADGMAYGTHVDDPIMGGQRTDLSFTLFLSDPASYEGGELVIEDTDGETEIKLDAGGLVLYPTTVLHRVVPVRSGVRLAAIGWVRSYIRRQDQRDILFDLELAAREIFETQGKTPLFDRLAKAKANLLRLWAED